MEAIGRPQHQIEPANVCISQPDIGGMNLHGRTGRSPPNLEIIKGGGCIGRTKLTHAREP